MNAVLLLTYKSIQGPEERQHRVQQDIILMEKIVFLVKREKDVLVESLLPKIVETRTTLATDNLRAHPVKTSLAPMEKSAKQLKTINLAR